MENFNWSEFSKRVLINSDLKSVYESWSKSENLEKWFLSKANFISNEGDVISSSTSVNENCKYKWSWFSQNHSEEGIVYQANGIDFLEFSFAGNCRVQVNLSKVNDQILVELTQKEIPLDSASKQNIRLGCALGWTFYLINLKSVLEGGLDLRNKDSELIGVVNN